MKGTGNHRSNGWNHLLRGGVASSMGRAGHEIERAVLAWEGVTSHPHRFGGVELRLGRIELGHLHGDHLADLPFPKKVRDELVEERRAEPHHVMPTSGWVSRRIEGTSDVEDVIALFRLNYDRIMTRREQNVS